MARVLMTGFEPFRHWQVNSSWEAVRLLGGRLRDVAAACLPVEHHAAAQAVRELIAREGPEVVLLAGLAPDPVLRLETVARPGPLAPWAGGVRRGRWGWPEALGALRSAGLPVRVSRDAGGYVCDTTYWAALGEGPRRVAFMHLPPPGPVWTPERAARALSAALAGAGLRER
ncbi:hypothetical protein H0I76_11650 [Limibaculum sp. M0105]|uniref:Pyroglutamyl-peptidase I n=1 Tax=Thermohalobaculum xanthum TaxID=2753746 RepID=A0A8J7M7Q8_9RHOB|nr:hypothetical protein [Thermohalobaculum xanthum]MBK0399846.1 hypothetical protein [Thermohalobaculum xanthum]